MTITGVAWQRSGEGDDWGAYNDIEIYMGLFESDDLTAFFDSNYVPGSRVLVFSEDSLHLEGAPGEWITIDLSLPYSYPGSGNLVIEIQRNGTWDSSFLMTWRWYTQEYRTLSASSPAALSGYRDRVSSMLRISYEDNLTPCTWSGIKSLFVQLQ